MADVFISYAREDHDTAESVARALEANKFSVWWDRDIIGGENFDDVIEAKLELAGSVIVLWSRHSARSNWVRSEAGLAAERRVLVPVFIEKIKLPLEFRRLHTIDLTAWSGDPSAPEFRPISLSISTLLGRSTDQASSALSEITRKKNPTAARLRNIGSPLNVLRATTLLIFVGSAGLLASSVFFDWPKPIEGLLSLGRVEPMPGEFDASEYDILFVVAKKTPGTSEEVTIAHEIGESVQAAGFRIDVRHEPSLSLPIAETDSYRVAVEYTPEHRTAAEHVYNLINGVFKGLEISNRTISLTERPFGSLTLAEGPARNGAPRGRPVYLRVIFQARDKAPN